MTTPDAGPVALDAGLAVDAGVDAGVSGPRDAGFPRQCVPDNSDAGLARREGFVEVCADPMVNPDAVCGDGVPYKFTVRPAEGPSEGLLIFFASGGVCADYVSCWGLDGRGGSGRRVVQLENTINTAPLPTRGVFDRAEPLNPFRQFDQIFATACTGDQGLGMEKQFFQRPPDAPSAAPYEIETFFHGSFNVAFVLEQAAAQFPTPKRVVLLGVGDGAAAAASAVPGLANSLGASPTTPLVLLTEGNMAVGRAGLEQQLTQIFTEYNGQRGRPFVRVGQLSWTSDPVQLRQRVASLVTEDDFRQELRQVVERRLQQNPTAYRAFVLEGGCHTVARSPGLFAQHRLVGGVVEPVTPTVSPNPDLSLAGVGYLSWLGQLTATAGPIPTSVASPRGDFFSTSTACALPTTQ